MELESIIGIGIGNVIGLVVVIKIYDKYYTKKDKKVKKFKGPWYCRIVNGHKRVYVYEGLDTDPVGSSYKEKMFDNITWETEDEKKEVMEFIYLELERRGYAKVAGNIWVRPEVE